MPSTGTPGMSSPVAARPYGFEGSGIGYSMLERVEGQLGEHHAKGLERESAERWRSVPVLVSRRRQSLPFEGVPRRRNSLTPTSEPPAPSRPKPSGSTSTNTATYSKRGFSGGRPPGRFKRMRPCRTSEEPFDTRFRSRDASGSWLDAEAAVSSSRSVERNLLSATSGIKRP